MESTKYFSGSWRLITRDKGWIKPILVMAAATLVPIAGYLGNLGYMLEYARLTAWGIDAAPKQKDVNVSQCIKSGWRGFVVELGLGLLCAIPIIILTALVALLPETAARVLGSLLRAAVSFFMIFVAVALHVAKLRATIYQSLGAGYKLGRIKELIQRDFGGFVKVFLVQLIGSIVTGFVVGIMTSILIVPFIFQIVPAFYTSSGMSGTEYAVITRILQSLVWLLPMLVVMFYVGAVLSTIVNLLSINATGLWMRQFNVPAWGRSEDPIPESAAPTSQLPGLPVRSDVAPQQHTPQQHMPHQSAPQQHPDQAQPIPMRRVSERDEASKVQTIPLVRKPAEDASNLAAERPQDEAILTNESEESEAPVTVEKIELPDDPAPAAAEKPTAPLPKPAPTAVEAPTTPLPKPDPTAEEKPATPAPVPAAPAEPAPAPDEPTIDDLYEDLSDAIRENDRVPEDDE